MVAVGARVVKASDFGAYQRSAVLGLRSDSDSRERRKGQVIAQKAGGANVAKPASRQRLCQDLAHPFHIFLFANGDNDVIGIDDSLGTWVEDHLAAGFFNRDDDHPEVPAQITGNERFAHQQ